MQAALRTPGLPPTEKLVLIALADHVTKDGHGWPAVPLLACEVGLSERQVQRILKSLTARGLIRRQTRLRRNGARTSDLYTLVLPAARPVASPRPRPASRREMSPQPVTPTSPRPMTPTSPEREQTTRNKPQGTSDPVGSERARQGGMARRDHETTRRSSRCPPDYAPGPSVIVFAEASGLTAGDVERELARLKDHEFRSPRADWDAAFRNWLRTALEISRHNPPRPPRHDQPGDHAGPVPSADPRRAATDARRHAWIELVEELAGARPGRGPCP